MLSLCKTWIEVLKFSIHFWGTSSFLVPQLWRDSLLFNKYSNYFHSIHQTYRSHIGATGVIPMLSLCKTWIEVLKFSIHFCGTSSISVPQLCEEIVIYSRDFSTTFIQCIHHNEVTSGQQLLSRCFHCARLESKYWNSVSTFGTLLHFQYHSCEEIVYFSRDFSSTFIQYIQRNEVTSGQQELQRCFHCAGLESMYWNSVYTFGALLQFQYHSCVKR